MKSVPKIYYVWLFILGSLKASLGEYNGINYESYDCDLNSQTFAEIDLATKFDPIGGGVSEKIDLSRQPTLNSFAMRFKGYIQIPESGLWTFYLSSNDGSRLYLQDGGTLLIDNNSEGYSEMDAITYLPAGFHAIIVEYYQSSDNASLELEFEGPGVSRQEITQDSLFFADPGFFVQGIYHEFYFGVSNPDGQIPTNTKIIDQIELGTFDTFPTPPFTARYISWLEIPGNQNETYTFNLASDARSNFYIGENSTTPFLEISDPQVDASLLRSIELSPGTHKIQVDYFRDPYEFSEPYLELRWSKTGSPIEQIPSTSLLLQRPIPNSGIFYQAYDLSRPSLAGIDFSSLSPSATNIVERIDADVPTNIDTTDLSYDFVLRFRGWIYIPEAGPWNFSISSDNNGRLIIDDSQTPVINMITPGTQYGYRYLDRGYHRIEVQYSTNNTTGADNDFFTLKYKGPSDSQYRDLEDLFTTSYGEGDGVDGLLPYMIWE